MNLAETHNKEGYFSPTEFEAMKRIESEEKKARRLAAFRPLVYICSPYRGNINENIENAQLWVFGSSISEGMAQEIQWAKRRHMPIRYFTEEMEEVV